MNFKVDRFERDKLRNTIIKTYKREIKQLKGYKLQIDIVKERIKQIEKITEDYQENKKTVQDQFQQQIDMQQITIKDLNDELHTVKTQQLEIKLDELQDSVQCFKAENTDAEIEMKSMAAEVKTSVTEKHEMELDCQQLNTEIVKETNTQVKQADEMFKQSQEEKGWSKDIGRTRERMLYLKEELESATDQIGECQQEVNRLEPLLTSTDLSLQTTQKHIASFKD